MAVTSSVPFSLQMPLMLLCILECKANTSLRKQLKFYKPPLVSLPKRQFWEMTVEILKWWCVTTRIWMLMLSDWLHPIRSTVMQSLWVTKLPLPSWSQSTSPSYFYNLQYTWLLLPNVQQLNRKEGWVRVITIIFVSAHVL